MNKKKIDQLKKNVLIDIEPPQKEIDQAWAMFRLIQKSIKENFKLECDLMGSVAKGTFLSGNKDLDIFVLFPKTYKRKELEDVGLSIGKNIFKRFKGTFEIDYAEHPYTKGIINGFRIEIVPCYKLKRNEKIISAVDRTPFHTEWINSHLTNKQKKEVLFLKAFLKGTGVYGSSLKIEGFSGYLCELLIAKFGLFENLIESAKNWGYKEFIDPQNHHKGNLPDKLSKKFKEDALLVIDPADSERNVASVLNEENYAKFIFSALNFSEKPEISFFVPNKQKYTLKKLKKEIEKRGTLLILEFDKPKIIEDILYPQLRKALKRIVNELEDDEFELFDYSFFVGEYKIKFLLDFKLDVLPKAIKKEGPRVYHNEDHIKQFSSKYPNIWIENNRVITIVSRRFSNATDLLKTFLKGSQKELENKGIPDHIAKSMKNIKLKNVEFEGENWLNFLAEFLKVN